MIITLKSLLSEEELRVVIYRITTSPFTKLRALLLL
jgi:hypothetical protein